VSSKSIARFAVAHLEDVDLVQRYVDELGSDAAGLSPRVAFSPTWVRAKQRGPVGLATYAVRHCTDPATLDKIAHSARRLRVVSALSRNPHLSRDTALYLLEHKTSQLRDGTIRRSLESLLSTYERTDPTTAVARANELLSAYDPMTSRTNKTTTSTIVSLLSILGPKAPHYANKFLDVTLAANDLTLATALLVLHYRQNTATTPGTLNPGTLIDPLDLLHTIPEDQRPEVIKSVLGDDALLTYVPFLTRATQQGAVTRETLFDLNFATELIATVTDPLKAFTTRWQEPYTCWTPEALELLLTDSRWNYMLVSHTLSDAQVDTLIDNIAKDKWPDILKLCSPGAPRNRHVVERLLREAPAQSLALRLEDVQHVLRACTTDDTELIALLASRCRPSALLAYLTGRWQIRHQVILPEAGDILELFMTAGSPDDWGQQIMDRIARDSSFRERMGTDYVRSLVDHLPGTAYAALSVAPFDDYVYERLSNSGANPGMFLDMIAEQPNQSLTHLVRVLTAFARVSNDSSTGPELL
jgi:hypothetical protein